MNLCIPVLLLLCALSGCARATTRPPVEDAARKAATVDNGGAAETAARVEWLRRNAAALRSVDPADTDYSDLAPIGRAIGNARVVFLGEPDHGTGNIFSAQARLVQYLHQQHGFDVLVFESGLYDVSKVWQAIRTGTPAHEAFPQGIFPAWSWRAEVRPLMDYLAKQAHGTRPLELAGYDAQFTGSASDDQLRADLRAFLDKLGVGAAFADDTELWEGLQRLAKRPTAADVAPLLPRLARVRDAVRDRASDDEGGFWLQVLDSTASFARQTALRSRDSKDWSAFNEREEQGARNLLWLANDRYRNRKLIVWLATMHAARNVNTITFEDMDFTGARPTGHNVWQTLGPAMYTIAMVALEGEKHGTGRDDKLQIVANQLPEAELEEMLGEAGFELAFLDYRTIPRGGEWLRGPLASRPLGNTATRARSWPDVVDGLLFIRHGKPATLSEPGR